MFVSVLERWFEYVVYVSRFLSQIACVVVNNLALSLRFSVVVVLVWCHQHPSDLCCMVHFAAAAAAAADVWMWRMMQSVLMKSIGCN